jgi:hypothetical protein
LCCSKGKLAKYLEKTKLIQPAVVEFSYVTEGADGRQLKESRGWARGVVHVVKDLASTKPVKPSKPPPLKKKKKS